MPYPFNDLTFIATTDRLGATWTTARCMHLSKEIDDAGLERIRAAVKARLEANREE